MIVGMNYNTDGKRYISILVHGSELSPKAELENAKLFLGECDEVYIININISYQPFIDEIVLKGCRIGV